MRVARSRLAFRRVRGRERVLWTEEYLRRYRAGGSIRMIARDTGRSYAFARRILVEGGAVLRPRGGRHPRRTPDAVSR